MIRIDVCTIAARRGVLCLVLACCAPLAWPLEFVDQPPAPDLMAQAAVSDEVLAGMRGGYELPSGLRVSFGIERAVFFNGSMVSASALAIPDVGNIDPRQAETLGQVQTTVRLLAGDHARVVQLGDLASGSGATLIQNTANNHNIAVVTTIDAVSNGLQLLKGMNLGAVLQDTLRPVTP